MAEMRVASVCSGIGGAELAFHGIAQHAFAAEIEQFPRAVLAHHFPGMKLYADFTEIPAAAGPVDVLAGGTPCQSFSVAGLRGGMADARGNLALEFLRLAERLRARWVLWENVPGVLSSSDGRDFGAFVGGLAELGYGWAYRVLDAQYFGLAQRRKRVFVVGHLGDWRRAAAVLFEPASLRGDTAPGREAREGIAETLEAGANRNGGTRPPGTTVDTADSLIADSLRADGFDASEDGTGRGTPLVAQAFDARQSDVIQYGDMAGPLDTDGHTVAVAFHQNQRAEVTTNDTAGALNSGGGKPGQGYPAAHIGSAVRRLTPTECEKLQGFPDGWTDVAYRGKPTADGPRYRALGNAFAVPVVRWIARRIVREVGYDG
jgi:DNA (cytosine-5)-methyltransferase 1